MTDSSTWITNRRPTKTDADSAGDVRVRHRPSSEDYVYLHWSHVGAGVPWMYCFTWKPPAPEPQPQPATTTPRKLVALTRTVHEFGHTLDAIADDGTAWCMTLITTDGELRTGWTQLPPLPAREIENE